jgi:XTP/dITP diphosphohydrolase
MPPRRSILLATSNPGKLREIRESLANLSVEVLGLADLPAVDEPAEDGLTFADNARAKAVYYSLATGRWCLADDSGLVVDALGGRPGVLSARYAADECPPNATREQIDQANNRKLLRDLSAVPDDKRTARFVCHLALADGQRVLLEASDTIEGRIGRGERGANGFGYDPLFIADGIGKTTAELSPAEKNAVSHRGKATRKFAELLREMFK